MNLLHPLLAAGLLVAATASAQKPQVMVSARQKVTSDTEASATRYTSKKEKDRTCELTIQLRNNDPKEHKVKVAWYFLGNPMMSGLDNFVYDKGEAEVAVGPRSATNLVQTSKPLTSKVAAGRHKTTKSGATHLGFIVVASQDTNLLGVAAMPMSMEKVARNPEEMTKLLGAAVPP